MFKTKCGEWFGEQLFGEQFDGKEKNTKTEQIVWEHIKDFSLGKWIGKTIPPFVLDSFKKLMLCKFCFGDLLIPTSKILYRGLVIYNNRLWKERIIKNKEKHASCPKMGMCVYNYEYNPENIIQSWTQNERVASHFADGQEGGSIICPFSNLEKTNISNRIPIILRIKIDNSLFGNPKLTNKIMFPTNDKRGEDEIYRIGGKIDSEILIPAKYIYI